MKTISNLCLSFLIALTIGFQVNAEELKTAVQIDSIVELAVNTNPEIKYYEAEIAKASGAVLNAQKLQNPELAFDLGRKDSSISGANQGEGVAWGVSFAQTFEYPGRIQLREAIAKKQVKLAELQLAKFKLALANKTRSVALDLYLAQQSKQSTEAVAKKVKLLVDLLSKREVAGPALLLERKLVESSALTFKQQTFQLAGEIERLSVELNTITGEDHTRRYLIGISGFESAFVILGSDTLFDLALENNHDVLIKKAELEQQGLKVKLSENEQNPSFTVRPYYSEEDSGELERTIGIGFSVPLPLWNDKSGNITIESANADQITASLKTIEREVKGKVASLQAGYKALRNQLATIGSGTINELRTSVKDAEEQYQLGAVPLSTYLQLQEQYLNNLNLHRASQIQLLKVVADLEQISGVPFFKEQQK